MNGWHIAAVALAVIVLDATLGRQLLRCTSTYRNTYVDGHAARSRRLMVYLPGILFDGDESVAEIKDSMLDGVSGGMFISYGFWRFLPKRVIRQTARDIGYAPSSNIAQVYDSIVIIGASFGGRVAADLCVELRTRYNWKSTSLKVIMIDTPCENISFKNPGRMTSQIMKWFYIGPLFSLIARLFIKLILVPPYDDEIERGLNKALVKKMMVDRMARFMMSMTADQQRYLADNDIEWTLGLTDVEIIYIACMKYNITVHQPGALNRILLNTRRPDESITSLEIESPHCGFAQMPLKWQRVMREALALTA